MQQNNYVEAEDAYRRALSIAPDNNKMCNLGICLMKQGRIKEAKDALRLVNVFLGSSSIWQPQPCKDHHPPMPTSIKALEIDYPDENHDVNILRSHGLVYPATRSFHL
ncbi:hypothetical protein Droror1_Dr00007832 [Drosera rotundifolia]